MIFSKQKKFLYIRVPKAASSFITSVLSNPYDVGSFQNRSNKLLDLTSEELKKRWDAIFKQTGVSVDPNHIPLSLINKYFHFFSGEESSDDYFKFSFVSNPYKRIVSRFFWGRDPSRIAHQAEVIQQCETVREYIMNISEDTWQAFAQPQSRLVEGCDFIGKCENLKNDLEYVCDKINIAKINLPKLGSEIPNASIHKHYTEYYDTETRDIISKLYQEDLKKFGYDFV